MNAKPKIVIAALAACLALVAQPTWAKVIGTMVPAEPISEARIARLPAAEQPAWRDYLARSRALMAADQAALAKERAGQDTTPPAPPSGPGGMPLDRPANWYASAEARHVADNIVSFQTPAGGWGKNQDRTGPLRVPGQSYVAADKLPAAAKADIQSASPDWSYVGTIDNGATVTELRFLARVQAGVPGPAGDAYRAAFGKGVRYLLAAQFPNGGWPQVYPLQGGYHDALTYNDRAMSGVARLLQDIADRQGDFAFVPPAEAAACGAAVGRARTVILTTQVIVAGQPTIWGQQHDALTLAPVGARNFEPAALATDESVDLLVFLMKQPDRSPAVGAAIRNGIAWLRAHALHDVAWPRAPEAPEGRQLVAKPGAGPLWARYYDLRTATPIFGDRDRTIHDDVNDLSKERRNGYSWFNTAPLKIVR